MSDTPPSLLTFHPLSPSEHAILQPHFSAIHDAAKGLPLATDLAQVDTIYSGPLGPSNISLASLPALRLIQTRTSGVDRLVQNALVRGVWSTGQGERISIASSSGVHASVIPSYVVGMVITLSQRLDKQIVHSRVKQTWAKGSDFPTRQGAPNKAHPLRGKTVGMLGYGHLGREAARLLQAFGLNIIAANSSGKPSEDTGYIEPETGDKGGSVPSEYYATSDQQQLHAFLRRSEILVCSLPSTPKTSWLLGVNEFAALPQGSIIINVGRGDLFSSDALLHALQHNVASAALDVTDPEPLPDGHPLFSHPDVLITHHLAGDAADEYESAARLLVENVKRMREGKEVYNRVDEGKGY